MATPVDDGPRRDRSRAIMGLGVGLVIVYWVWLFGLRSRPPVGPSTGVFECDEYLAIMERCLVRIPEGGRAGHAELIRTTRGNLTRAATRLEELPRLTRVCTEMRDAVRRNPQCR